MRRPDKKDFEVYDKHLDKDGSYKSLGDGRWYNNYMYQEALTKFKTLLNLSQIPRSTKNP